MKILIEELFYFGVISLCISWLSNMFIGLGLGLGFICLCLNLTFGYDFKAVKHGLNK